MGAPAEGESSSIAMPSSAEGESVEVPQLQNTESIETPVKKPDKPSIDTTVESTETIESIESIETPMKDAEKTLEIANSAQADDKSSSHLADARHVRDASQREDRQGIWHAPAIPHVQHIETTRASVLEAEQINET